MPGRCAFSNDAKSLPIRLNCTNIVHPMHSSISVSFAVYSPKSADILWDVLKAARFLVRLRAVAGMRRLVAGPLAVGDGGGIGVGGDDI